VVKIIHSPYAVDVYTETGAFAAGITKRRMDGRDAPYLVAEALQQILQALGHDTTVTEDKGNGGQPYTLPERTSLV